MNWIRGLWKGRQVEAGMREEMEFHREARISDLIRGGMDPAKAARKAHLEFGSAEAYRDECRREIGYWPWDGFYADLRFAGRGMKNNPGFTAATIAILALAIGVNGGFFSLYSNYLLKPLAIRCVERHFSVSGFDRNGRSTSGWSSSEVEALRRSIGPGMEGLYTSDTFQALAAAPVQRQTIITGVSGNYFRLLGGTAIVGRTLDETLEHDPVAVLSSSGAARFFPNRDNPIGQNIRVRTTVLTVIGVMRPDFTGTEAVVPDFWVGNGVENSLRGRPAPEDPRRELFGFLAPGVPVERAQAGLTAAASHFPRPDEAVSRVVLRAQRTLLPDGEGIGGAAALLFVAFWMVLLITCANLANLHVARGGSHPRDRHAIFAWRFAVANRPATPDGKHVHCPARSGGRMRSCDGHGASGPRLRRLTFRCWRHHYAPNLRGLAGAALLRRARTRCRACVRAPARKRGDFTEFDPLHET
jgi:hypothetical protein